MASSELAIQLAYVVAAAMFIMALNCWALPPPRVVAT